MSTTEWVREWMRVREESVRAVYEQLESGEVSVTQMLEALRDALHLGLAWKYIAEAWHETAKKYTPADAGVDWDPYCVESLESWWDELRSEHR